MQLIYKEKLKSEAPFPVLPGDQYLDFLKKNEGAIYQGTLGVYLARKVIVDGQEMFQPYLDIDGTSDLEREEKILSAIEFARLTAKTFENYGVLDHFRFLATGGSGFRAVANILLNRPAYLAFVEWARDEMPHIHDLKPSREVDFPHQVIGYKGDVLHNDKALTDSHSVVIDKNLLLKDVFTVDDYLQATDGKPDPREIFVFVEWVLSGPMISDLSVLGTLGDRIEEYQRIANDFNVDPFSFIKLRKDKEPIGLEVMQQMLAEKGLSSIIESRGSKQAISFRGRPCPICGDTKANARAYPPSYKLKCFNSDCQAHNGVPLHVWAKIKNSGGYYHSPKKSYDLSPPTNSVSLADARNLIGLELKKTDDSLLVLTPGVGKTHSAMDVLSKMGKDKVIVYGAFNRQLQGEAYNKICQLAGHSNGFHLLQSQEATCRRVGEVKSVTRRGFSPKEILCNNCTHRETDCDYFNQRKNLGPGVYFVTLHMLQYLEDKIPQPDLIVLDENLKAGLLLEDSCTELQMKSLLKIVEESDARLIKQLLDIFQKVSVKLVEEKSREMIFNGHKLTEADETTIIDLLSKSTGRSEEEIAANLDALSKNLNTLKRTQLFFKGFDMNAIAWISALCSRTALAFVHIDDTGEVSYKTKRITPLGYHDSPIKILDATGDAQAIEPLVRRKLKTVRADVAWKSNRVHIKKSLSRKDMALAKEKDLEKLLAEMLSKTQAQKIMVITYMRHEDQVLKILKVIDPARDFMIFHFLGPRGINDFASCEAVLVVGLPYSNLNSAAQDACILFPNERDIGKRIYYAEANMQWEFVQAIHRIRPIYKANVDIVLAANSWPSSLPKPNVLIDQSQDGNWKEIAIKRLKPFVEEYGFLNQDIGFLANVYIKEKAIVAHKFQTNLSKLTNDTSNCNFVNLSQFCTSLLRLGKDFSNSIDIPFKDNLSFLADTNLNLPVGNGKILPESYSQVNDEGNFDLKDRLHDENIRKSIFVIYILILKIDFIRKHANSLLANLINKGYSGANNEELILSNTTQWSDLIIDFKNSNPHFEEFSIKLPHARGNRVKGVGNPERVKEFYKQINDLGIVGKVNIDSYQVVAQSACSIDPIPEGFITIYLPDDEDVAFVAWGAEFSSISVSQESSELRSLFEGIVADSQTKIITNNGKRVAKFFLSCGLARCELIDVVITEKLLANGEVPFQALNLKTIFKRHDFPEGMERSIVTRRLFELWGKQGVLIQAGGLRRIFEIESQLIWVTAKIEESGIGIDLTAMVNLHDDLKQRLKELSAEVEGMLPAGIALDKEIKLVEHLNSEYELKLAKIDEHSIAKIPNVFAKFIAEVQLEYGKIKSSLSILESYMHRVGTDDRYRDNIDQVNAVTGRFYRLLGGVPRKGPLRSLFRAKEGYKLVKADYSQEEPRIMAALSGDPVAIELFKAGKDIYLEAARIFFGDRENLGRYRGIGKGIVIGLINGEGLWGICGRLKKIGFSYDSDQVMYWVSLFNQRFPGIDIWRSATAATAKKVGSVTTKLGRLRKISEDNSEDAICNHPIQGTAADGFKLALIELDDNLAGLDAQIVHIMHDEIIVEAREDIADEVAVVVKECMEGTFAEIFPEVPFVVKPEIRDTWG